MLQLVLWLQRFIPSFQGPSVAREPGIHNHPAFADFDKSLELDPGNYRDSYARATLYLDRHDYARALQDYDLSIKFNSSYAGVFNARCLTRAIVGHP